MTALPAIRTLTIAGSDSGGGAGIQADLKTFAALGAFGTSAITAITAQNTQGVQQVHVLPREVIEAQCDSVLSDIRIDAAKIGILPTADCIRATAAVLQRHKLPFVVLDPVLVATSGDSLALENTVQLMLDELMPLSHLLTPNLDELARLTGHLKAKNEDEMREQGQILLAKGARAVLLKGGHWQDHDEARDWLIQADGSATLFATPRVHTPHTHGTGCTLSAAIAALYPRTGHLKTAVQDAKNYLFGALQAGSQWQVGQGRGPLAHQWQQWHEGQ